MKRNKTNMDQFICFMVLEIMKKNLYINHNYYHFLMILQKLIAKILCFILLVVEDLLILLTLNRYK